jgi:DNA polymerase-3 subunit delta'
MTPRENPHFYGHTEAVATLTGALAGARLHHAWIFAGPEGVGKATLAYRFARALLAGKGRGLNLPATDPVFRRVAAATHADLFSVEREWDDKKKRMKKNIAAEDARDIPGFLRRTAAEGGARCVIVDGAEDLNKDSANALLKILEEPPESAVLILTTSAPSRLLPTIKSRCRMLKLGTLADDDVWRVLEAVGQAPKLSDRAQMIKLARGSPGRALTLMQGGGLLLASLADEMIAALPKPDLIRGYQMASELKEESAFELFMALLAEKVADIAAGRLRSELLAVRAQAAWAEAWAQIVTLANETQGANMDRKQAAIAALALLRVA